VTDLKESAEPVLRVTDLTKHFKVGRRRSQQTVRALDSVSLELGTGQTIALVGESGCGKSTFARTVTRLYRPTSGTISVRGHEIADLSDRDVRSIRPHIQMIFQNPATSLDPRLPVLDSILEPLRNFPELTPRDRRRQRAQELCELVGLPPSVLTSYPRQLSGGQRQRIAIARALALAPAVIVADEPTASLDVSTQAQIVNLMLALQRSTDVSYLFITHNLALARHLSHRVAVMYLGRIVEFTDAAELFEHPMHPYSVALLSRWVNTATTELFAAGPADASQQAQARRPIVLRGEVPSPASPPSGCHFRTRCPIAAEICGTEYPPLRELKPGHQIACHFPGKFAASGTGS
jgi:oligopeptide transport system ATP-binding protein